MDTIGQRIRFLRKKNGIHQIDLARETGISRSNISKIESNDIKPASNSIVAIADYFRVSTDWLLKGEEYQEALAEAEASYNAKPTDLQEASMLLGRLEPDRLQRVMAFARFELTQQEKKE